MFYYLHFAQSLYKIRKIAKSQHLHLIFEFTYLLEPLKGEVTKRSVVEELSILHFTFYIFHNRRKKRFAQNHHFQLQFKCTFLMEPPPPRSFFSKKSLEPRRGQHLRFTIYVWHNHCTKWNILVCCVARPEYVHALASLILQVPKGTDISKSAFTFAFWIYFQSRIF